MTKYCIFRKLMDFLSDEYDLTDADMNNYAGNITISGTKEDGSTITVTVEMKEGTQDGT